MCLDQASPGFRTGDLSISRSTLYPLRHHSTQKGVVSRVQCVWPLCSGCVVCLPVPSPLPRLLLPQMFGLRCCWYQPASAAAIASAAPGGPALQLGPPPRTPWPQPPPRAVLRLGLDCVQAWTSVVAVSCRRLMLARLDCFCFCPDLSHRQGWAHATGMIAHELGPQQQPLGFLPLWACPRAAVWTVSAVIWAPSTYKGMQDCVRARTSAATATAALGSTPASMSRPARTPVLIASVVTQAPARLACTPTPTSAAAATASIFMGGPICAGRDCPNSCSPALPLA
ncbi:uncharacterized protein [Saccopteryx bilineata]|uniref:uncharacterized protein isoform X1 n=1 Tax=Saccopteryx bilineata TaxID=59482 RepID=UPI00339016D3